MATHKRNHLRVLKRGLNSLYANGYSLSTKALLSAVFAKSYRPISLWRIPFRLGETFAFNAVLPTTFFHQKKGFLKVMSRESTKNFFPRSQFLSPKFLSFVLKTVHFWSNQTRFPGATLNEVTYHENAVGLGYQFVQCVSLEWCASVHQSDRGL